jgi:hypothetical protein
MKRENPEVLNHIKVISLALFCFCGKMGKIVGHQVADKVTMGEGVGDTTNHMYQ